MQHTLNMLQALQKNEDLYLVGILENQVKMNTPPFSLLNYRCIT